MFFPLSFISVTLVAGFGSFLAYKKTNSILLSALFGMLAAIFAAAVVWLAAEGFRWDRWNYAVVYLASSAVHAAMVGYTVACLVKRKDKVFRRTQSGRLDLKPRWYNYFGPPLLAFAAWLAYPSTEIMLLPLLGLGFVLAYFVFWHLGWLKSN